MKYGDDEQTGRDEVLLSRVLDTIKALLRAGASREECQQFVVEATAGDYHGLLLTCTRWSERSLQDALGRPSA